MGSGYDFVCVAVRAEVEELPLVKRNSLLLIKCLEITMTLEASGERRKKT